MLFRSRFVALHTYLGVLAHVSCPSDDIALAAAASFTTVALMSILYTGYTFIWRVFKIRYSPYLLELRHQLTLSPAATAKQSTTTTGSARPCSAASCSLLSSSTSPSAPRRASEPPYPTQTNYTLLASPIRSTSIHKNPANPPSFAIHADHHLERVRDQRRDQATVWRDQVGYIR